MNDSCCLYEDESITLGFIEKVHLSIKKKECLAVDCHIEEYVLFVYTKVFIKLTCMSSDSLCIVVITNLRLFHSPGIKCILSIELGQCLTSR